MWIIWNFYFLTILILLSLNLCESVCKGFWPWADTLKDGYPSTYDGARPTPCDDKRADFICAQQDVDILKDCFSVSFGPDLFPGMYCMPSQNLTPWICTWLLTIVLDLFPWIAWLIMIRSLAVLWTTWHIWVRCWLLIIVQQLLPDELWSGSLILQKLITWFLCISTGNSNKFILLTDCSM